MDLSLIICAMTGAVVGWNLDGILGWIKRHGGIKRAAHKDKRKERADKATHLNKDHSEG